MQPEFFPGLSTHHEFCTRLLEGFLGSLGVSVPGDKKRLAVIGMGTA